MTAPIDLDCPFCKSTPGNYCMSPTADDPLKCLRVTFHHAARIDAAARESDRGRRYDPTRLRAALHEAVDRLAKHQTSADDLSFIITMREVFEL